ncbi:hypothetical protein ACFL4T_08210 [candidate division KSB1 bacterium]
MKKNLFKLVLIPLIICFFLMPGCSKNSTGIKDNEQETEEPEINPKALSNLYEFINWVSGRHSLLNLNYLDNWEFEEEISGRSTVWKFENSEKEIIITETLSVETTTNFQVKDTCDGKLVLSATRFSNGQILQEYYNGPASSGGGGG